MAESVLQLDPCDNVVVALKPLKAGTVVRCGDHSCTVTEDIPAKHKLAIADLAPGDFVFLYGMVVGEAVVAIPRGGLISTRTIRHRAGDYTATRLPVSFPLPDSAPRTFMGYHRADGQVGTRNYWIVLPLVFCENRNVEQMREALEEELGYGGANSAYRRHVRS
jgi:altronate hydrolase